MLFELFLRTVWKSAIELCNTNETDLSKLLSTDGFSKKEKRRWGRRRGGEMEAQRGLSNDEHYRANEC